MDGAHFRGTTATMKVRSGRAYMTFKSSSRTMMSRRQSPRFFRKICLAVKTPTEVRQTRRLFRSAAMPAITVIQAIQQAARVISQTDPQIQIRQTSKSIRRQTITTMIKRRMARTKTTSRSFHIRRRCCVRR